MSAARDNAGKPELSQLLHFDLAWLADHMAAGRAKYPDTEQGTPNWRLGGKPDQEYLDAAMRHLMAFTNGEEFDPELGTHHLAAVAWNMMALLTCNRDYEASKAGNPAAPVQQTLQPFALYGDWPSMAPWEMA